MIKAPEEAKEKLDRLIRMIPDYDPFATADDGQYFDYDKAFYHILWIEEHIRLTENGRLMHLYPWQCGIVGNLFGWRNPDGSRRYQKMYFLVPRKNGKTELAVAMILCCAYTEALYGGEVYFAAGQSKQQAGIAFDKAVSMVRSDKILNAVTRWEKHAERLVIGDPFAGGVTINKVSSKGGSKHGYRPWLVLLDELHVISDAELLRAMKTGSMTISNPLHLYTTTWGLESELLLSTDDYARRVRNGEVADSTFLPVIYEADKEDDWRSPKIWAKSNPMYGVTISEKNFRRSFIEAKSNSSAVWEFQVYNLNQRTQPPDGWITSEMWEKTQTEYTLESWVKRNSDWAKNPLEVWIGLDLGHNHDFTAAVFCFAARCDDGTDGRIIFPKFWTPEYLLEERGNAAKAPFRTWVDEGFIETTAGNGVDYEQVRRDIRELTQSLNLRVSAVAVDPQFQGLDTIRSFSEDDGWNVLSFAQSGQNYSFPTFDTERLITEELLWHDTNPLMRWMVGNTAIQIDRNENKRPRKRRGCPHGNIDGVVAMIMSIAASKTDDKQYNFRMFEL